MKKMLKVNMLRLLLGMSTLVFLGISGSFTAYAGDTPAAPQQHKRVVKGRVTDKKTGEPIVGATVWFKESTSGTATDAAGNYSLNRPQGNAILSVSFIGYKSQEVVLGKEDVINFQLEETSEMIEEAVVVGYGSRRKESVIGAITTVGVAELKQPTGQISNSLAGRLAGVVAVQRSGEPGQSSEFWNQYFRCQQRPVDPGRWSGKKTRLAGPRRYRIFFYPERCYGNSRLRSAGSERGDHREYPAGKRGTT